MTVIAALSVEAVLYPMNAEVRRRVAEAKLNGRANTMSVRTDIPH